MKERKGTIKYTLKSLYRCIKGYHNYHIEHNPFRENYNYKKCDVCGKIEK